MIYKISFQQELEIPDKCFLAEWGQMRLVGFTLLKTGIGISAGEYHSDSCGTFILFDLSLVRIVLLCTQYEERIEVLTL